MHPEAKGGLCCHVLNERCPQEGNKENKIANNLISDAATFLLLHFSLPSTKARIATHSFTSSVFSSSFRLFSFSRKGFPGQYWPTRREYAKNGTERNVFVPVCYGLTISGRPFRRSLSPPSLPFLSPMSCHTLPQLLSVEEDSRFNVEGTRVRGIKSGGLDEGRLML